jgi:hypothetical protein
VNADPLIALTEPAIRVGEAATCLYDEAQLPSRTREHVFNSAWGGKHLTSSLVCDACNHAFGKDVDPGLLPLVDYVMNGWNVHGERKRAAPAIAAEGGVVLGPYGQPRVSGPQVKLGDVDGRFSLSAPSKRSAFRYVESGELERELGRALPPSEKAAVLQQIREAEYVSAEPGPLTLPISLDLQAGYRSAAHTALKALGLFEPELARSSDLARARLFARHGEGAWDDFAVTVRPIVSLGDLVAEVGPNPLANAVEVWFDEAGGQVVAVLTVLGRIRRAVRLSEVYEGPNRAFLVWENAVVGGGRIHAHDATFRSPPFHRAAGVPLRLVEVESAPTVQELGEDAARVASQALHFDAPLAVLSEAVRRIERRQDALTAGAVDAYREALADYAAKLSRLIGAPLSNAQASAAVDAAGFVGLAEALGGRPLGDVEVQEAIADVLGRTVRSVVDVSRRTQSP